MIQNKKVILVAEDEEPLRRALKDVLTAEGLSVFEAKNGVEGLDIAIQEHPDLILLDILMPRMDGLEMLKKIRESEWGKKVPVIVLTNLNENEDIAEAMGEEVFEYFVKADIKIDEVVQRVKTKLGIGE